MKPTVRAAVVQMHASLGKADNLAAAERLVREAAAAGAELVVLPEMFNAYGPLSQIVAQAEPIPGPTSELLASLARELAITLCGGSFASQSEQPRKACNTSLLFGPAGEILARYDKRYLFDVEIPDKVYARESQWILPGREMCVTITPLGALGQAICFDLRFPEHFRELAVRGAEMILLPAAFTVTTGRDHWEVLLRSRAIENQCYVLAANQFGVHGPQIDSYGGSLIIDPWGEVLARAPLTEEAVLIADLSAQRLGEVRERLPLRRDNA